MPDVNWNSKTFAGTFDWHLSGGEEWSEPWGGSEAQWFGSLYPRLHRFLPAHSILEIAPGFGRWTKFLLPACQSYLGVDLSQECVDGCRQRFASTDHARFVKNDGLSLADAPDGQFDFAFSFDALVHVEVDVLRGYITQILRKLTTSGVAFLHHSNFAALPPGAEHAGARGQTVSGTVAAAIIREAGGKLLVQERINWGAPYLGLLDCLTLFAHQEHEHDLPPAAIDNMRFMQEASLIRDTHAPYCKIARYHTNAR
jgi:2-polyprenyl-3-methyl-5-hydroxy-6-metoxy-1,4-benzoquinol methylase